MLADLLVALALPTFSFLLAIQAGEYRNRLLGVLAVGWATLALVLLVGFNTTLWLAFGLLCQYAAVRLALRLIRDARVRA